MHWLLPLSLVLLVALHFALMRWMTRLPEPAATPEQCRVIRGTSSLTRTLNARDHRRAVRGLRGVALRREQATACVCPESAPSDRITSQKCGRIPDTNGERTTLYA